MVNAIKYGVIIGALSALWIILMHVFGYYHFDPNGPKNVTKMEYLSILIPFLGLYFGIKSFRNTHYKGKMSFFEGMMQGFKMMLVGGVLYMATLSIYLRYTHQVVLEIDYMQRLVSVGVVGILLVLVVSLLLMTTPRDL